MQTRPSAARAGTDARTDLGQLQGVWTSVQGRREAELLIAGNLYAIRFFDGKIYMGTFDLDADEHPRCMLMRVDEGPLKHKGKFAPCIYELDGDTLRWCPVEPGSDERLGGFPPVDDDRYLCLVFRREPPRRRQG